MGRVDAADWGAVCLKLLSDERVATCLHEYESPCACNPGYAPLWHHMRHAGPRSQLIGCTARQVGAEAVVQGLARRALEVVASSGAPAPDAPVQAGSFRALAPPMDVAPSASGAALVTA